MPASAGIECLIRIQPLDDFHDGVKVTLPSQLIHRSQ